MLEHLETQNELRLINLMTFIVSFLKLKSLITNICFVIISA